MTLHDLCKVGSKEVVNAYLNAVSAESPDDLGYVLDLRNEQRYTALHCAIFARNAEALYVLVSRGADVDLKCHGTPPVHLVLASAVQPGGQKFAYDSLSVLLENNANASVKDDHGYSLAHLAAEYNLPQFLALILKHTVDVGEFVNNSPKLTGITPLHRAASTDGHLAAAVLLQHGAAQDSKCASMQMTALHMAATSGSAKVWQVLVGSAGDDKARAQELLEAKDGLGRTPVELARRGGWTVDPADPSRLLKGASLVEHGAGDSVTAIVTNPLCTRHYTCPPSQVETPSAPPENTKRLHVLVDGQNGALQGEDISAQLRWVRNAKLAVLADVLRVHEWSYVRKVQEHCAGISSDDPENEEEGFAHLDGDTAISSDTYNAALAAAGAVCQAVDLVAGKQARNAFCPVRPPGHHAGPKGVVRTKDGGSDSHGFCILNNVSIGAAYAMNRYRESVERVAIVDFDVHHGNGTEETVRWLKPSVEAIAIDGSDSDVFGVVHRCNYKPWYGEQDPSNVMFVSVHGYGPRERGLEHLLPRAAFYPGSGKTSLPSVPPPSPRADAVDAGAWASSGASSAPGETISVTTGSAVTVTASTGVAGSSSRMDDGADEEDEEDSRSSGSGSGEGEGDRKSGSSGGSDGDYGEEGEDGDDEENSLLERLQGLEGSGGGGVYGRVLSARNMLGSFAPLAGSRAGENALAAQNAAASAAGMPALILDIGVELPRGEAEQDRGKALAELNYRIQWRKYFRDEIFPRLMQFKPDFLFISAGFDAHKKDTINGGYISLIEEDFEWVTEKLVQIANSCCQGRVVSVLEGGYQLGGEFYSAFAQSAKTHVRSLSLASRSVAGFNEAETKIETALELQHMDVLEELRQLQLLRKEQAREQAYMARVAQLEREREAQLAAAARAAAEEEEEAQGQDQDQDRELTGHREQSHQATAVPDAASPAAHGGEESGRKRRRQQVDYQALDKELREGK